MERLLAQFSCFRESLQKKSGQKVKMAAVRACHSLINKLSNQVLGSERGSFEHEESPLGCMIVSTLASQLMLINTQWKRNRISVVVSETLGDDLVCYIFTSDIQ